MIYGDPYKFALQFDAVKCWNEYKQFWIGSVFTVYIEGKIFFPSSIDVPNVTLNIGFGAYQINIDKWLSRAINTDKEIEVEIDLNRNPGEVCEEIYEKAYGRIDDEEDVNIDEKDFRIKNFLDLTSMELMDEGHHIFCFLLDDNDIIFYGTSDHIKDSKKAVLPKGTIRELLEDIAKYPLIPPYRISWGENYHYYP
ncbi:MULTISPECIES: Imm42 family immunity protein [unclassified Saccharibacter]|uniref:Imm42 family immunity protein n=1 Tax=unclassified Saccharibacter TaxID=2648722 RepID=UPI0013289D59|nr:MULTISPECIES: Imm42 family immunity protein [unclassified Saccharibacter]MXV37003.1 hypothetical protein [Saccharibacter sp. EH611]MXV58507.1 hypothetical protein [Saccharibacter sp. EH70]MXV66013.1 hypothetical protein [Saccharibacter sp. EH60]